MRTRWLTIVAAIPLAGLGGCANGSAIVAPLARDIGAPPAYLVAEPVPEARPEQSVYVDAAELRHSLGNANVKIACARAEWDATRAAVQKDDAAHAAARAEGAACVETGRLQTELRKPAAAKPARRGLLKRKRA